MSFAGIILTAFAAGLELSGIGMCYIIMLSWLKTGLRVVLLLSMILASWPGGVDLFVRGTMITAVALWYGTVAAEAVDQ